MSATIAVHEHHWVSGPRANGIASTFEHAHELPSKYHRHPCTGPGHSYTWKAAKKPRGEELRFIGPEPGEDTFKVVMEPTYTSEHERNGTTREEFELQVGHFRAIASGQAERVSGPGAISMSTDRMERGFGLTAIHEISNGGAWCCGKPREAHPVNKSGGWYCPEGEEADRQRRARLAERTAAEMAEMGWPA